MRARGPSNEGRQGSPKDGSARLPEGYSVEAEGGDLLLLRRADGSAVAAFAFSAFGPTPETLREAAEEDLRRLGSRTGKRGNVGRRPRGSSWRGSTLTWTRPRGGGSTPWHDALAALKNRVRPARL